MAYMPTPAQPTTIEMHPGGTCAVKVAEAFCLAFPSIPGASRLDDALIAIQRVVEAEARTFGCTINSNAFNNARGAWFEMLLYTHFYNLSIQSQRYFIFRIPNVNQFAFTHFFNDEVRERLGELEQHLRNQMITLKMSNPDFLCVDLNTVSPTVKSEILSLQSVSNFDVQKLADIENVYLKFAGACNFDSIRFAISVKTSTRPDRRYQFIHEGNIIKALTAHLQTRFWRTDFGIKFYALTNNEPTVADREVLKTAAISSITNVFASSVRAVDEVYWIQTSSDLDNFFNTATT